MAEINVDFNRPVLVGNELENMRQAVENGHISGDGSFTKKCHSFLESELGVPKALLTTSCTHALEMCAILLDIQPGDEVIIPDFTFVSTVNAYVLRGAKPIFIDIRPDTLNLDESKLEAASPQKQRQLFRFTMPVWVVRWRPLWRLATITILLWWKIMRMVYLANTEGNTLAPSVRWHPNPSTRPRTSTVEKVVL